ncbi:MAG: FAD-dependent oxidoreductase [Microscillaceae bacterium]|nr:FAD-dependent oxidoreductase [Microscillaceae bacterium]
MIKNKNARIAVVGAGAGGISTAYFLQKKGYKNVTVLEKAGAIGGKCNSLTYQTQSFDLGANYITSSYKNVKKIAREVGAKMFTEKRLRAYNPQTHQFKSLMKALTEDSSFFSLAWQSLRYFFKRWSLNRVISAQKPGYAGLSQHPELTCSFEAWLHKNKLAALKTLFSIPISLMGYGSLNQISAAHALTYMSLGTFIDLVMVAFSPQILGYPKRFTEGYARFLERISWQLQVMTNVEIHQVKRSADKVVLEITVHEQILTKITSTSRTLEFDYLIVASPLTLEALQTWLTDIRPAEAELFDKVRLNPYILTTYIAENMQEFSAVTYMLPEPKLGQPYVLTRQFFDNDLISFYTRTRESEKVSKEEILKMQEDFVTKAGGKIIGEYYTYTDWPYFPHFSIEDMQAGYYDRLEELQGQNRTFYVGGLLNFELVETIFNYSKYLVKKHF